MVSGAGDIHHALHDVGTQNQQEVPQPLSSHHRAGQSLPTFFGGSSGGHKLLHSDLLQSRSVSPLVATNLSNLTSYRAGQSWWPQTSPILSPTEQVSLSIAGHKPLHSYLFQSRSVSPLVATNLSTLISYRAGQSLPTVLVSCLVATNLYALHECNQDCDDWLWEDQPVPVISVTMLTMVTVVMMMVMTGH